LGILYEGVYGYGELWREITEPGGRPDNKRIVKEVLRWPDNNSMFRRLSCNRATSKE
jgi:hypothetical protein